MTTNHQKKSDARFAFFGTPTLAAVFLDELEKASLVPALVVTTRDKPRGRGLEVIPPPAKQWAQMRGIPVLQPEVLDSAFASDLAARSLKLEASLFVVIYYGKVLPRAILDIPTHGTLNTHFSLLPRWRGTSPVRAAIANGDRETGTSIILLDEKVDHGPLIAQKRVPIDESTRASELEESLTRESAKLLISILPSWLAGDIEAREQNHDIATLCPKYTKEDGLLDLHADAHVNLLKIRAFDTTVGTYTFFERNGKKIRVGILDAHLKNDKLVIDTVKPEGKREMPYEEFLRSGAVPL